MLFDLEVVPGFKYPFVLWFQFLVCDTARAFLSLFQGFGQGFGAWDVGCGVSRVDGGGAWVSKIYVSAFRLLWALVRI